MVCRKGDGRTWRSSERSTALAIKSNNYSYDNYEDDCQNYCGGDGRSCSGPSLEDRHYRSVLRLISKARSAGLGPGAFAVALTWEKAVADGIHKIGC